MDLQRNKVKKSSFYRRQDHSTYQETTNSPTLDERVEGGVKIVFFPKIIIVHL